MKVDLEKLVSKGSHVRTEIKPTVVIGEGSNAQGELLDSNATEQLMTQKVGAIVENALPTKVSDLRNDAGYLTSEDISELSNSVSNIQNLIAADEEGINVAIDKFEEIVDFLEGIEPGNELYTIIHSHIDNGTSGVIRHVEVLTQAQYDSLATKDVNTEYNII